MERSSQKFPLQPTVFWLLGTFLKILYRYRQNSFLLPSLSPFHLFQSHDSSLWATTTLQIGAVLPLGRKFPSKGKSGQLEGKKKEMKIWRILEGNLMMKWGFEGNVKYIHFIRRTIGFLFKNLPTAVYFNGNGEKVNKRSVRLSYSLSYLHRLESSLLSKKAHAHFSLFTCT